MHQATIEIAFVNPPNKNPEYGSVKDTSGTYWSVPKTLLPQFSEKQTYAIEYTDTQGRDGKTYHNIKSVRQAGPPPPAHNNPPANGHANGSQRYIYLCGLLNNWARAGNLPVNADQIEIAILEAYEAYDRVHNPSHIRAPSVGIENTF